MSGVTRPGGGGRHRQGPSSRPRLTPAQPARRVAFEVLEAVRESDAYANLLLPTKISRAALDSADAALATELTYGTLRMMGYYDRVISIAAGRPVDQIDPPILDVLRLGVHQILSTRIAPHAAVNESVSLARTVGSQSATGFSNGVLRTISRSTPEEWRQRVLDAAKGSDDRLAAEYSHPGWVVRALRDSLQAEGRGEELEELLLADNTAPRVNMVALPGLATEHDVDVAGSSPNRFSPLGFVLRGGDPQQLPAVHSGTVRVQDEGSQLAALALSRARGIRPGESWLDLCAGPGGKAALLAAEARQGGATLVANELIPARVDLVRRALGRLESEVEVHEGDGIEFAHDNPGRFDRILLDAPCTGLGALRRRPEARWRKTPRDVAELTGLQARLLDAALGALAPGGIVAYVTCSPHLAETRLIVDDAVAKGDGRVRTLDTAAVLESLSVEPLDLAGADGMVQLWPHRHGTDAMFIALLTRD
ncbi:RsmB/NOP family class I SAM-dependent RNA methyltransferase [Compostimonas suwonensis]|uniref:16S rRNA (Cytosine967-C5)-methyltransferase n=1 Tax=Compostimonas suwonensis TaxID=1048394 RepID=A0A2M9BYJ2_9MICO|nr:transcription antitermination factor NusB [Compostimonas suwonensis]PJJ63145.1 16S rRNA (cytosine967-C5)-methyltransferase [Compostimonas suwonensis]